MEDTLVKEPTEAEITRGLRLVSNTMLRKQLHTNEVALKALYVDWALDKLNLNRFR